MISRASRPPSDEVCPGPSGPALVVDLGCRVPLADGPRGLTATDPPAHPLGGVILAVHDLAAEAGDQGG